MGSDGLIARAFRYDLRTPVVLHLPEGKMKGHSLNVSESGMLVVFDQALDIWLAGRLSALIGEWFISINVRVARVDRRETGLTFQVAGETDRATIRKLIELAGGLAPGA